MTTALTLYGMALQQAVDGHNGRLDLLDPTGRPVDRADAADWTAGLRPGDRAMLDRCQGATLDVGCGPGRLAAALTRDGRTTLGVDVCPEAVRQTRRRGAAALHGNVFAELPGEGGWSSVLLADGNIGIGGNPHRLLRRCARLLHPGGTVLAELRPPGAVSWTGPVRLRLGGVVSQPFPWATVAAHEVADIAHRAGFGVRALWTEAGRWFAHLSC
jgi:SAM-dependent methyltransferase